MTVYLTIAACIILLCVLLNRLSFRFGVPMLLMFIVLGMVCGIDGLLGIPFDNYKLAEQICSTALIFIMFTGGFGTNGPQAKPVAVKAAALSTVGVFLTALLTGGFCYFVLKIQLWESFLIGAILSSTDAASVFSILRSKKLGLKENTASLLEMESGSNDPCSYMLTAIVLSVMNGKADGGQIALLIVSQAHSFCSLPCLPYLTIIGALFLCFIELKSIFEKAEDKTKFAESALLAGKIIANKDDLKKLVEELGREKPEKETNDE